MKLFKLRAGRASDVAAMYRLDLLCFQAPFRLSLRMLRTCALQAGALTIVAEFEDELIGFVIVELHSGEQTVAGYVITLDVHAAHRRKGVAAALMMRVEGQAAEVGAREIELHVSTENKSAISFYQRAGYAVQLRVENFYGWALDAWVYSKVLAREAGSSKSQSSAEKSSGRSM